MKNAINMIWKIAQIKPVVVRTLIVLLFASSLGSSKAQDFQSSPTRICTLENDLSYDFTECDKKTNTMKVFFYYRTELRCNFGKSDLLPTLM